MEAKRAGVRGLYCYCIRPHVAQQPDVPRPTMGQGAVYGIPCRGIEAMVSEVDVEELSSAAIQRKAQEDMPWIAEKAQVHQEVIAQVARAGTPVIPMRFGVVFHNRSAVEGMLEAREAELTAKLEQLAGKQEWAVKVYVDRRRFNAEVRAASPVVRAKERALGIASAPAGVAYFLEKQLEDAVSRVAAQVLPVYPRMVLEQVVPLAEEHASGKLLAQELTGKPFPMVLNVALLMRAEQALVLQATVHRLQRELAPKGFQVECSGPWPPYTFV